MIERLNRQPNLFGKRDRSVGRGFPIGAVKPGTAWILRSRLESLILTSLESLERGHHRLFQARATSGIQFDSDFAIFSA